MQNNIYYLKFKDKLYPYREIWFENKWNIIATTELCDDLINEGTGKWVSNEARKVDEKILFYMDIDQFLLPINEIVNIIKENIK